MAVTKREWFTDSPAGFFEWIERERPDWPDLAKANGGYAYVPGFEDACAAWDAAVCAAMKHIHEVPIRDLHDKVYSLRVGPPAGEGESGRSDAPGVDRTRVEPGEVNKTPNVGINRRPPD